MISILAGCSDKPPENPVDTPFAIYSKKDDIIIKIGDKREDVEQLIGPDEMHVAEFMEDNVERVEYWDTEGVFVDYDTNGVVCAVRFKTSDWQLENGLGVLNRNNDVAKNYPEEHIHKYSETEDLWIAYDKNGNTIKFEETAPYIIRFDIQGGLIYAIAVQDNTVREGIF